MTGAGEGLLVARVELSFLDRARTAFRALDLRPAWKEARKPVRADQRAHAKAQEGPGGAWQARSSSTKSRAGGRRTRARRLLGRLPSAIGVGYDRRKLTVRSLVRWSAIHQEGGTAGHGARIPARPFLWVSDSLLEHVAGVVAKVVAKQGFG